MFDAKKETEKIIKFIRNYYQDNNLGGCVLGISGGKDSGVVAGLMCEAIGSENVLGLTLPCHSKEDDKNLAQVVSNKFGFKLMNLDLTDLNDKFLSEVMKTGNYSQEELKNSEINIKPRLRMMSCYYMAALMSAVTGKNYIVVGTSNKCELYVGYFTKGGDSVHDIAVIADLTVDEVIKVGEVLGVPREVLYKTPDDGLSGMTDEEKLGVKYSDIAKYMNGEELDSNVKGKIKRLHNSSRHKFNIPTYKKGN